MVSRLYVCVKSDEAYILNCTSITTLKAIKKLGWKKQKQTEVGSEQNVLMKVLGQNFELGKFKIQAT